VVDLFSGSARVAHAFKARGYFVHANDYAAYAYTLARALVEADRAQYLPDRIQPILDALMRLPPEHGWFTRTYCDEARYFRPENGARIEAIRNAIAHYDDPTLQAVLLTSLMLAADKVDSTTGLQMAYLKAWAPRAYNPLQLRYPPLLHGTGKAYHADALELAGALEADLFLLRPAVQSALVPRELPCVGDAGAVGLPRNLRRRPQARRCQAPQKPVQRADAGA
jgi:adenine-specific DNA-methyltransferase